MNRKQQGNERQTKRPPDEVRVLVQAAVQNTITVSSEAGKYDVALLLTPAVAPQSDINVLISVQGNDCGSRAVGGRKAIVLDKLALDPSQDVEVVVTNAGDDSLVSKTTIPRSKFPNSAAAKKVELMTVKVGALSVNRFNPVTIRTQNADGTKQKRTIEIMIGQVAETLKGECDTNGLLTLDTDDSGVLRTYIKLQSSDVTAVITDDRGVTAETSLLAEP